MHSICLTVVTPGRKEIHARNDLNGVRLTNAVTFKGFEEDMPYSRNDLLALARMFTGLANMIGE